MSIEKFIEGLEKIAENIPDGNDWVKELYLPIRKQNVHNQHLKAIEDLFNYYDLSKLSIGLVDFNKNIEYSDTHIFFGFNDACLIGINKFTGEIDYVDSYNQEIVYKLAPNLDVFLQLSLVIGRYFLKGFLGATYSKHDRSLVLERIKNILDDKKYLSYYSISFGEDPELDNSKMQ